MMDYFSKWVEVELLNSETSTECISKIKKIFSTRGIPEVVVADNMSFNSSECKKISNEWNFVIHHHQVILKVMGRVKKQYESSKIC